MATVVEALDVAVSEEIAGKAAVEELGALRRRLAELETKERVAKAVPLTLRALRFVAPLCLLVVLLAGAAAVAHRLVAWGWQ